MELSSSLGLSTSSYFDAESIVCVGNREVPPVLGDDIGDTHESDSKRRCLIPLFEFFDGCKAVF